MPHTEEVEMATYQFKALWRGLQVTRPGNEGDIVFYNHRHRTSSDKDAEILRGTNGVFEIPAEPAVEVADVQATDPPPVVPDEQTKPKQRRVRRKG